MSRITMISNELAPHRYDGGLGIAVERLCLQLKSLGTEVTVIFPTDNSASRVLTHEQGLTTIAIPAKCGLFVNESERAVALTTFCFEAFEVCQSETADSIICHDNETALVSVLLKERGLQSIFWLHSLYDTPRKANFPSIAAERMSSNSILATGITSASLVVTSNGMIGDAREFPWPGNLVDVQEALLDTYTRGRVLIVESLGCLPQITASIANHSVAKKYGFGTKPFVLFASRPTLSKGIGLFNIMADMMRNDHMDFVAVGNPTADVMAFCKNIKWIPWLERSELFRLMAESMAVVHPSLTEGFGLSAAESTVYSDNVLCHPVGGLNALIESGLSSGVSISTEEKEMLYEIWAGIINSTPELYWELWNKKLPKLYGLASRWVASIRTSQIKNSNRKKGAMLESWGSQILKAEQDRRRS